MGQPIGSRLGQDPTGGHAQQLCGRVGINQSRHGCPSFTAATVRASRLRTRVAAATLSLPGRALLRVSISEWNVGVVVCCSMLVAFGVSVSAAHRLGLVVLAFDLDLDRSVCGELEGCALD